MRAMPNAAAAANPFHIKAFYRWQLLRVVRIIGMLSNPPPADGSPAARSATTTRSCPSVSKPGKRIVRKGWFDPCHPLTRKWRTTRTLGCDTLEARPGAWGDHARPGQVASGHACVAEVILAVTSQLKRCHATALARSGPNVGCVCFLKEAQSG